MTLVSRVPVTNLVGLTKVEDCWSKKRRVLLFLSLRIACTSWRCSLPCKTAGWIILPPFFSSSLNLLSPTIIILCIILTYACGSHSLSRHPHSCSYSVLAAS
ncbi:hypothetical protein COCSADRAFT_244592 [Bipolaris sorokiniana ND90Pr]|uniref:Uncharacterized protein n=1 Tax=Cochliobolus sativus (strain ND90Pr / ATCC 201652) TaxID=665912 RepID=M2SDQ6_COCSN|nr:uncharacterized protein COCSADRAFT_244592 [Bipolaris sorokiniana ND90Pr]EMD60590.1 hypothetical protein COCSADRAFT_244592 [Bipolaris sorokiniana ND90Pr]